MRLMADTFVRMGDERLRVVPPEEAAVDWLKPITELG